MTESSPLLTRAERTALGKDRRAAVPREAHAAWKPGAQRDPMAVLAQGDVGRVPDLVPLRYARMGENPFAFLRGAAAVMAADLVGAPMAGLTVQACGDCHIGNFGVYLSPEGRVMFDINDFDETLPGVDFTVDVKRLAASVAVAALVIAKADPDKARKAARASVGAYRAHMRDLADLAPLACWKSRIDIDHELARLADTDLRERIVRDIDKGLMADGKPNVDVPLLDPATRNGPPETWRIAEKRPTVFRTTSRGDGSYVADARAALERYPEGLSAERRLLAARYALRDVAFKVVGIGSVGTVCAVGLYTDADGAPLFLQIKEAKDSVLAPLVLDAGAAPSGGQRVVDGQRIMQAASDLFLGVARSEESGRCYYVRQLKNRKLSSVAELLEESGPKPYAQLCGTTLARAHARSGDVAAIAGYLGGSDVFDEAIADFAMAYAQQTLADHGLLCGRTSAASAG